MGSQKYIRHAARKPKAKEKNKRTLRAVALAALAAALLLGTFVNRGVLEEKMTYSIEASTEVRFAQNNQTLVIDNGKETLLLLDADGRVADRWDGGDEASPFFYACHAVQAPDGCIYVADITYGNRGNLLDQERVLRYDGSEWETVFEVDYTSLPIDEAPMQYGRILELEERNGAIWFVMDAGDSVQLYVLGGDGKFELEKTAPADFVKTDAAYDPDTGRFILISRTGAISIYDAARGTVEVISAGEGLIPFDISVRGGVAYYTELTAQNVRYFSLSDPENGGEYPALDTPAYKLDVSEDGTILATDYVGYYVLAADGSMREYVEQARVTYSARIAAVRAMLALGVLAAIPPVFALIRKLLIMAIDHENTLRVILIVAASMAVSNVIAYSLLGQIITGDTASSETRIELISQILLDKLDVDSLKTLGEPSDYDTEAFDSVKTPLDKTIFSAYERKDYYYYMIYRAINGKVSTVMDFEDTLPCAYPVYEDDPEDNDYANVLHTGESKLVSEMSAYGAWMFLLSPVEDENGDIVALLEVGQSLVAVQGHQTELKRELLINVTISTVVMTMLLLELTFLFSFAERKRESKTELDNTERVPLRTLMFLTYLSDSMQDAFIAILCSKLYDGGLPLPTGVAVALPMTAQLLMMAVFSYCTGRMVERFGSKKCLSAGMLVQLGGFLCCVLLGSYSGILLGKMLIGSGMGMVYVTCNTVASTASTEEKAAEAFAGVSAGTLSGLTIGAGLASVLLSFDGWRMIYTAGAVISGFGLMLAVSSGDVRLDSRRKSAREDRRISFREFFYNRRVAGFFLLILLPFMMALSYREYFFPLFAQEHGLTEVRISQLYLLCGMLVLYIGPALSSWILKHAGALWSVVAASVMMGLLMLIFALKPTLESVIVGVVLLSVVISFAYTCQYTYFGLTRECEEYGEGRSMGVYSVVESLGQTSGPVCYGALLGMGYVNGISLFCAVLLILTAVFSLVMYRHSRDFI